MIGKFMSSAAVQAECLVCAFSRSNCVLANQRSFREGKVISILNFATSSGAILHQFDLKGFCLQL